MALQDLTPQLRTRLNRMERVVGLFLTLATLLFLAGLAYYVYHSGVRKGWFVNKVQYQTSINSAEGLRVGNEVFLMGFPAGRITGIVPNAPGDWFNVTVYFEIYDSRDAPYYGYIWTDSQVRVAPAGLLGQRNLEVIKGTAGVPTVRTENGEVVGILRAHEFHNEWADREADLLHRNFPPEEARQSALQAMHEIVGANLDYFYMPAAESGPYWLTPQETPAVTERVEQVMNIVDSALPNILNLTNQLAAALNQTTSATRQVEDLFAGAQPLVGNLTEISEHLRDPDGSLGRWLLTSRTQDQLQATLETAGSALHSADDVLQSADEHLAELIANAQRSLDSLASLTSNLNAQVEANTNILSEISSAVVNTDNLVQGLKQHWLFRSAFRDEQPERQPRRPPERLLPPRLQ